MIDDAVSGSFAVLSSVASNEDSNKCISDYYSHSSRQCPPRPQALLLLPVAKITSHEGINVTLSLAKRYLALSSLMMTVAQI